MKPITHWREMHPQAQDQYVAVWVLGYTYRERFRNDTQGYLDRNGESIITEELPNYTTCLAAATAILLWMKERSSSICFDWNEDDDAWECSIITGGVRYTSICAGPALAICTAALKAVGKDN